MLLFIGEWFHVITLPGSIRKWRWTKEAYSLWPFVLHHAPLLTETAQTFQSVSSRALAIHWVCNILINAVCFETNFSQKGVILWFLHGRNGRKYHLPTQQVVTWGNTKWIFQWICRTSHSSRPNSAAPILCTSCRHCAQVHYITIMFLCCTPQGYTKAFFSFQLIHFQWPGLVN